MQNRKKGYQMQSNFSRLQKQQRIIQNRSSNRTVSRIRLAPSPECRSFSLPILPGILQKNNNSNRKQRANQQAERIHLIDQNFGQTPSPNSKVQLLLQPCLSKVQLLPQSKYSNNFSAHSIQEEKQSDQQVSARIHQYEKKISQDSKQIGQLKIYEKNINIQRRKSEYTSSNISSKNNQQLMQTLLNISSRSFYEMVSKKRGGGDSMSGETARREQDLNTCSSNVSNHKFFSSHQKRSKKAESVGIDIN